MKEYKCPVCGNVTYSSLPLSTVKCRRCCNDFATCDADAAMGNTMGGCNHNFNDNQQQANYAPGGEYRQAQPQAGSNVFSVGPSGRSRGVAALFAIFLGTIGIHYFYVGKTTAGVICLLLTILSCGWAGLLIQVMTLVQGILMFTMSEDEFDNRYVYTNSTFPF